MTLPFLLEIGTEEIPDWMIPGALESLHLLFEKTGVPHETVKLDATPRRLVLRADGLPLRLPDREERVQGPARSAPAKAVEGFARKQGVLPEDLIVEVTAKGEYYCFVRKVPGRSSKEILAEALPGLILAIYFPKTMYWTGKGGPRFIRPIRWIVALLGEEIIPFELAGVHSGALTAVGIDAPMPEGTFYLWAHRPAVDGWELARELAERAGLLVSPGEFYGSEGSGHVRVALVQPDDAIERVVARLKAS